MTFGSVQLPETLENFGAVPELAPATYPDQFALDADCPSVVAADAEGAAAAAIEPAIASADIRRGVFMFLIRFCAPPVNVRHG